MHHITLIWPNMGRLLIGAHEKNFSDNASMEPLPLAVIASLIPEDIEVQLFDDRFDEIPYNIQTDLVCISIEIFTARRGYEIADEFRKRNIKVVLGGIHASLIPDEVKEHADAVFMGDAEEVWPQLLSDLRNNSLKPFYQGPVSNQIVQLYPNRKIYKQENYLPIMLLQFGRGCAYSCNFCAIAACFRQTHITRKVEDVIAEIQQDGRRLLFFVDDNIVANPAAAKKLFRALIPLNIKWMGQASIDMANDPELLRLMYQSGCLGHVIGFEAVTKAGLVQLEKHVNLVDYNQYATQIKRLTDNGIQIWAALVVGHDADTPESVRETLDFTIYHKFAFAAFNILMPYPKTPFYEDLQAEKRLLYEGKWWLHPDYRFNESAFIPKNFSPDQLSQACRDLKTAYNSYPNIFRRVIKAATTRKSLSAATFLLRYGYLFRKESHKKNYLKLGKIN